MTTSRKVIIRNGKVLRTHEVFTTEFNNEDIKNCREMLGLPLLTTKNRNCLRCGCSFCSEGNHNRLCNLCKLDFATIPCSITDDMDSNYRSTARRESVYRSSHGRKP